MKKIKLSVHELVDFILRTGDIDSRIYNFETMNMGSKIHSYYQKAQNYNYLAEYKLEYTFLYKDYEIELSGRSDGIIIGGKYPVIDEIKSTVIELEKFYLQQQKWHFGQAECYAYMYALKNSCEHIEIQITYLSQMNNDKLVKKKLYSLSKLQEKVYSYFDEYISFQELKEKHFINRNASIKDLSFPFPSFRLGQKKMCENVYKACLNQDILFCEAPTGSGKTISVLYASLKSLLGNNKEKIFYLTAKISGRKNAYDGMSLLYEKNLVCYDLVLKSKESMCLNKKIRCNPDECIYCQNYYTKLKKVILECLNFQRINNEAIIEISQKYQMCPFELQLDLSNFVDVIICDYNYVFDPFVRLDRYFNDEKDQKNYILLIDEAHNLIDRGREMYSKTISLNEIKSVLYSFHKIKRNKEKNYLKKLINEFENELTKIDDDYYPLSILNDNIYRLFQKIIKSKIDDEKKSRLSNTNLIEEKKDPLSDEYNDFCLKIKQFIYLYEEFSDGIKLFYSISDHDFALKLFCVDPSIYLKNDILSFNNAVLFSATLSPIKFYMSSILKEDNYQSLTLTSPFPKENFRLLIANNISTRYNDRTKTYNDVAQYILSFISAKIGNYFVYFPSYKYLENIKNLINLDKNINVFIQERNSIDDEEFLAHFPLNPQTSNVGFLISGGRYSEGIDLISDRLIGVVVVGVGMPQICLERNLIKEEYDVNSYPGFYFSYVYPGLNKVMQEIGRIIRNEKDIGCALLIDDRYLNYPYKNIFSKIYPNYVICQSKEQVLDEVKKFFTK